ncbi:MAG TPA: RIP metalloprotease RseP [Deltaproteobacteria bacterium]|nr:RIP metalloprotease RseP [Deltaproteobacteria bacterium]HPR54882.1 RIP metalloprotease RseP [Deltaproteobacteria bacterium]HXK48515.1 RIP metalloprotease RseP [Deltaproteobacteria bacterium]
MITILAFIIVLGVLIFFHELGHFIVAKASGVGVLKFSLGFGPALLRKRIGETQYQVAAFPLGGYVKMLGEDPDDKDQLTHIDPKRSFSHKPLPIKAAIVFAGPFFNFILAVVVYTVIAWVGVPYLLPVVGEVQKASPADKAGMLAGDMIRTIGKKPVQGWDDVAAVLQETGAAKGVEIEVLREGKVFVLHVTPTMNKAKNLFGEEISRPMIGIAVGDVTAVKRYGPISGIGYGFSQCYHIVELTGVAFAKMIKGSISVKESLGGPILIAQVSGQTFKAGLLPFVSLIAFISINLAIINLLPIPVLDGGHILLFLIEGVTGKPVEGKPREIAQQIGLFILIMLMLFAFYNDIVRIFKG